MTIDFRISDQGSVVGFTPMTAAAREFFENEVSFESWQVMGLTVWADHRAAFDLMHVLEQEGFALAGDVNDGP
jgi:hypothetical protein